MACVSESYSAAANSNAKRPLAPTDEEGLSQADLAEAVGVTRQTINPIERNRYDPSLELALAGHFDCAVEDIFELDRTD